MASTFNGLCSDLVVLPVRSDEPDINNAVRIVNPHDDAILVAGDVGFVLPIWGTLPVKA
jgi:hypothetical protein